VVSDDIVGWNQVCACRVTEDDTEREVSVTRELMMYLDLCDAQGRSLYVTEAGSPVFRHVEATRSAWEDCLRIKARQVGSRCDAISRAEHDSARCCQWTNARGHSRVRSVGPVDTRSI